MLLQIPTTELLTYIIGAALLLALLIILIFALAFYRLAGSKVETNAENEADEARNPVLVPKAESQAFSLEEITDEDMMVAALIATIDYASETKKDVRLLSIKQIS
jgi:hypothetical protein